MGVINNSNNNSNSRDFDSGKEDTFVGGLELIVWTTPKQKTRGTYEKGRWCHS